MDTQNKFLNKLMMLMLLAVMPAWFMAQQHKVAGAIEYMEKGKLDSARILIDAASLDAETSVSSETWYVRGFVYMELCKVNSGNVSIIKYSQQSFESLKKSIQLDTAAERITECRRIMKGSLLPRLNNSLSLLMDTAGFTNSEKSLQMMKQIIKYLNPRSNPDSLDPSFYNAVGTYYQNQFSKNIHSGSKFLDIAQDAFNKVLIVDPNNYSANYNMGIVFYNQGVNLIIRQLDYDADIGTTLASVQDKAVEYFKKSLPYMLKAYSINPNKKEPIIGLSGIYFSLNEDEKYLEFKRKTDELENPK